MFQYFSSPFEGLETRHLQEKYFRENFGLVVSICNQTTGALIIYIAISECGMQYVGSIICTTFLSKLTFLFNAHLAIPAEKIMSLTLDPCTGARVHL